MFFYCYCLQVKAGTIFDNFLITDDEEYAAKFGDETWGLTKDAEKKMKEAVILIIIVVIVVIIAIIIAR